MNRFEGKVVIVTGAGAGAGSGIGATTSRRFLQEGALVVLNGRREHKLHETLAVHDAAKALVQPGDVSDEAYVKRLVEDTVNKFGRLDVLINNAAMAIFEYRHDGERDGSQEQTDSASGGGRKGRARHD